MSSFLTSGTSNNNNSSDTKTKTSIIKSENDFVAPRTRIEQALAEQSNNKVITQTLDLCLPQVTSQLKAKLKLTENDLQKIVHRFQSLTELDLTNNDVKDLPEGISQLNNLKVLKLNRGGLKSMPKNIELVSSSLRELHLQVNQLSSWPQSINRFQSLEVLDLGWNNLNKFVLKEQGWNLTGFLYANNREQLPINQSLKSLSLKCNELTSFPYKVCEFTNLKELILSKNAIKEIPDIITKMTSLEILYVDGCELTTFPKAVCALLNLRVLNISENQISKLPSASTEMKNLIHLEEFYANSCQLTGWSQLYCQAKLKILHLSGNNILGFPTETQTLSMLRELKLNKNKITHIPEHITAYTQLQSLDLSDNQISDIDEDFGKLSSLKVLNLARNQIYSFPSTMRLLINLESIDLRSNQIEELFDWDLFQNLREFKAPENQIRVFPRGIDRNSLIQSSLVEIDFTFNRLSSLPDEFFLLKGLTSCRLKHNSIDELSPKICQLQSLVDLNLDNNEIRSIPVEITQLTKLTKLYMSYNYEQLQVPPEVTEWVAKNNIEFSTLFETASKISKGLYLGSANAATNKNLLKSYGVTHVLTVAHDIPPRHTEDFKYMIIETADTHNATLRGHFADTAQFIKEGIASGGVIVHCMAGVSRSATIMTSFIMQNNNLRVGKAFKVVGKARPQVKPNDTFKKELQLFDKELFDHANVPPVSRRNKYSLIDPVSRERTIFLEDGKVVRARISRLLDEKDKMSNQQQKARSNSNGDNAPLTSTVVVANADDVSTDPTLLINTDISQQQQQQQNGALEVIGDTGLNSSTSNNNNNSISSIACIRGAPEEEEVVQVSDPRENEQSQHQQQPITFTDERYADLSDPSLSENSPRRAKRMARILTSPLNFASTSESDADNTRIREYLREKRTLNENGTL